MRSSYTVFRLGVSPGLIVVVGKEVVDMLEFILRYWLEALFGLIVGVLAFAGRWLWKQVRQDRVNGRTLKAAMQALLRAEIINVYNHYEDRECLPIYARENLHALYKQYKALGGNGAIEGLVEIADTWPTSSKDEGDD